jgi:poly(glycerol-phosphate) alpha-glucosyltransferase
MAAEADGWTLVIAGEDEDRHELVLRRMIVELGIEDSVLLPGPLFNEKKASALEGAEAFVLPSFSEGLPNAVLEAWAWRLPVLMTPQCNLPEGFAEGAAVRVEPDAESLGVGLKTLFHMSDSEREEMGVRGWRLVEERFSWPRVAGQMVSVYNWMLGAGPRPDCVREA